MKTSTNWLHSYFTSSDYPRVQLIWVWDNKVQFYLKKYHIHSKYSIINKKKVKVMLDNFTNTTIWTDSSAYKCILRFKNSELDISAVDCELGQIRDCKIGICCFSTKPAVLKSKRKGWLERNQNNVSKWGHMSVCLWTVVSVS